MHQPTNTEVHRTLEDVPTYGHRKLLSPLQTNLFLLPVLVFKGVCLGCVSLPEWIRQKKKPNFAFTTKRAKPEKLNAQGTGESPFGRRRLGPGSVPPGSHRSRLACLGVGGGFGGGRWLPDVQPKWPLGSLPSREIPNSRTQGKTSWHQEGLI